MEIGIEEVDYRGHEVDDISGRRTDIVFLEVIVGIDGVDNFLHESLAQRAGGIYSHPLEDALITVSVHARQEVGLVDFSIPTNGTVIVCIGICSKYNSSVSAIEHPIPQQLVFGSCIAKIIRPFGIERQSRRTTSYTPIHGM